MLIPRPSFYYQFQLLSARRHRSRKLPTRLALPKFTVTLVAVALALAMTGCGGGGGGSAGELTLETRKELTVATHRLIPEIQELSRRSDVATPQFGSVTQSVSSVTQSVSHFTPSVTANASTNLLSADRLIFFRVVRSDGTNFEINSAHEDTEYIGLPYRSLTGITGRRTEFVYANPQPGTQRSLEVTGIVDWNSTDLTDYFAGGIWLDIDADLSNNTITYLEFGAFADGPEFRGTPSLPQAGRAEFNGHAIGSYLSKYGTDRGLPAGATELGGYFGDVTLNANFADSEISGLIDDIQIAVDHVVDGTNADSGHDMPITTQYQIHLEALIEPDGTFSGTGVSITNPRFDIESTSGKWGGRFSDRNDSRDNPRAVAATHVGTATTARGSETTFFGAFIATTEDFE